MIVEANKKILIIRSVKQEDDSKRNGSAKVKNEKTTETQQAMLDKNGRAALESAMEADLRFLKRLKNMSEKNLRFTQGLI